MHENLTASPIFRLLPFIIFIEGFVSIAVEILTIRQLLPFAGNSVIITSLIIGVFLLFLALGYHKGGRITENLQKKLRNNFLLASLWLGIGLSYFFITIFFEFVDAHLDQHILYPVTIYLLIVLAPLIYILGQTVPITMHLAKQNKSVGAIGGDTLSLSTLGSFLGATVTALVFMQFLGVAWTLFINFIFLITLALLLTENRFRFYIYTSITLYAMIFVYYLNITLVNKTFTQTNPYGNYAIFENSAGEKILNINNSKSSRLSEGKKGFEYIEHIKNILFHDLKLRNSHILVLGAGGFTLSAENNFHNHFTYVDIDGELYKIVIPKFNPSLNGDFISDDARHYVHVAQKKYQAIVVDTYSNKHSIPAHLLTYEYMAELKHLLTNNGIIIFNVIANPHLNDAYSKHVDNTIRAIFKSCMVLPQSYSDGVTNILYVCRNTSNAEDSRIYTDNQNTSTMDYFNR